MLNAQELHDIDIQDLITTGKNKNNYFELYVFISTNVYHHSGLHSSPYKQTTHVICCHNPQGLFEE